VKNKSTKVVSYVYELLEEYLWVGEIY
jgi:hypothetical protein